MTVETSKIRLALQQARKMLPNLDKEVISICASIESSEYEAVKNNYFSEIKKLVTAMRRQKLSDEYIEIVILESYGTGDSIKKSLAKLL